jgi:hypothetical protein
MHPRLFHRLVDHRHEERIIFVRQSARQCPFDEQISAVPFQRNSDPVFFYDRVIPLGDI